MDLRFPIQVKKTELNKYISYTWNDMDGTETLVEIHFEPKGEGATKMIITEKSRDHTEAGINWLRRNTESWANFLACLKAWLEYGIHLREGAFDPMDMPE